MADLEVPDLVMERHLLVRAQTLARHLLVCCKTVVFDVLVCPPNLAWHLQYYTLDGRFGVKDYRQNA